jgi:FAD/FMN-containing dehydrogenase
MLAFVRRCGAPFRTARLFVGKVSVHFKIKEAIVTTTLEKPSSYASLPWRSLHDAISGDLLLPDSPGYEAARHVWNGMIDRRPAAIARARTTEDVVAAVNFARENGLEIAVRGGGHNAAGLAVVDDGLVIDLTEMNQVQVDPERGIARAGGGATWRDFDAATQAHGLATTGGVISMTGVGGLTLGGGLGVLMRSRGLACDNLIGAQVVLADGSVVRTSETERPELLWGLRGGGGNFGVVTELEFRLYPLDGMYAGLLIYPRERAVEALQTYREQTAAAPDELNTFIALLSTPDGVPVVAFIPAYAGDAAAGEAAVAGYRAMGEPIADIVGPMPYVALQQMLDDGFQAGPHVYWRSHFITGLSDEAIEIMVAAANAAPSPLSSVLIEHLGGAVARVGKDDTAFDHRDAEYNFAVIAKWTDPAEADVNIAWARDLWNAMQPYARGVYVNYLGVGDSAERVRAAYSPEKYARLAALKREVDPENLFHRNQNIPPA